MNKTIYFDNSATTRAFESVIEVMSNSLREGFYNPSSGYKEGISISKNIELARKTIAKSIGANSEEVLFTSGGTESTISAVNSVIRNAKGRHIISSEIEHDATLKSLMALKENGFDVTFLKPDNKGVISLDKVKAALKEDTILVSLMHVNNELGSINDIEQIGKWIKSVDKKIVFHVDAVQSYMKEIIDVKKMCIDMMSISAHKVNGPKGVGALYIKSGVNFVPLILGGGQEQGRRSGTENVHGILGFEEAVRVNSNNFENNKALYKSLSEHLINGLLKIEGVYINSDTDRLGNIVNASILGVKSEVLINSLSMSGVMISSGSACSTKKKGSHVLRGIGLSNEKIDGAIRVSFSSYNTIDEVQLFLQILEKEVIDIRKFTKYKKGR